MKSTVRLFADDCLLYCSIRNREDHLALERDLQQLETWAHTVGNACIDMVYSKELECDVTNSTMAKAILRLKTVVFIYSFIEHDWFNFFTSEEQIRAVMYIPCVKCSCSELKLAKHLHTFFVLT